jgi:hypothetical protein
MDGPVRFRGVTWVAVPRALVARVVVGLIMATGALTILVLVIVQSFRREPESWYVYPLLVLGLAAWLAFVGLVGGAGVYVRVTSLRIRQRLPRMSPLGTPVVLSRATAGVRFGRRRLRDWAAASVHANQCGGAPAPNS